MQLNKIVRCIIKITQIYNFLSIAPVSAFSIGYSNIGWIGISCKIDFMFIVLVCVANLVSRREEKSERTCRSFDFFSFSAIVKLWQSDEWVQNLYTFFSLPQVCFLLEIPIYIYTLNRKADSFCSIFNCWFHSQSTPFIVNSNVWPPVYPSVCLLYYYLFAFAHCVIHCTAILGLSDTQNTLPIFFCISAR